MSFQSRIEAPSRAEAFTLIELLVAIVVIGVLVVLAYPEVESGPGRRESINVTLSDARQLHLATQTMSLDTFNAGGAGMEWTAWEDAQGNTTYATVAQYFDALVKGGYLSENDLVKLVTAPGKGPGRSAPTAQNSCFKFFPVDEASPSDQPLMVTANWSDHQLTTDAPYGVKGFVVFTKGGSGGVYTRKGDASSTNVFPVRYVENGQSYPSMHYSYVPLK